MVHEIHTGFYTNDAKYIFERMLDVLAASPFYLTKRQRGTGNYAKIEKASNGEMLITVRNNIWCTVFNKISNDIDARNWLAFMMKQCVFHELQLKHGDAKHLHWKRNDKTKLVWFSSIINNHIRHADYEQIRDITIEDVYCMYDLLRNRKNTDKRYDAKMIEKLVGHENDPFTTEQENVRRTEIARIEKEKQEKAYSLRMERDSKITKIREEIYNEYTKLTAESDARFDEQIKQLNEAFAQMTAIAAA